jgi:alpha-L-fucosidase
MTNVLNIVIVLLLFIHSIGNSQKNNPVIIRNESQTEYDKRMEWWREARFGLFIHWGLYAVPAGEWKGKTDYGEWIRHSGQIPLEEYEKFLGQFNPEKFNAEQWVRTAKEAGMKYIVITSKHHDGFCLFDSKYTDFCITSTPFKRDILKELAQACRNNGMKLCFYHSIMDWHHADYLPRRDWETTRSNESADFERFVQYLKNELKELLTNYGDIGVLWFDGNWESTWSNQRGMDLYNYVRSLQPNIIVNNRVGQPPSSESGIGFRDIGAVGDYGTPEQEIPAIGLPGISWETCMTMNDHWGYNSHDLNFKSTKELLRNLTDIASKGGNFLLNVGPTSEGLFPQISIDRLHDIGDWMKVNGESIYGTAASPFAQLQWGRCTQKNIDGGTRLYLHVFDWPADGRLVVPGVFNQAKQAFLLSDQRRKNLTVTRQEDALIINVPAKAPSLDNSVVVLDVKGNADVSLPPKISAEFNIFIDTLEVDVTTERENIDLRYTLDGSVPSINSPTVKKSIRLTKTATVSARAFRDGTPVSGISQQTYNKVQPRPAVHIEHPVNGITYNYYEGDWDSLPNYHSLVPVKTGELPNIEFSPRKQEEHFGFMYEGFIRVPQDGVYKFFTASDDGSRLYIGDTLVVDNDRLHGMMERQGVVALSEGFHPLRVTFFEKTGEDDLKVYIQHQRNAKQLLPDKMLFLQK